MHDQKITVYTKRSTANTNQLLTIATTNIPWGWRLTLTRGRTQSDGHT